MTKRHSPRSRNQIMQEASEAIQEGDTARAIEILSAALREDPNRAELHNLMASAYQLKGNPAKALDHIQRASLLDPDLAEYQRGEGIILAALNRYDDAENKLSLAAELNPESVDILNDLAVVLLKTWQPERAEKYLRKAIDISQNEINVVYNLSLALIKQNKFSEAEEQFLKALKIFPGDPHLFYELGRLQFERNHLADAEATLKRGLAHNPEDLDTLTLLARVHGLQGAIEEGEKLLRLAMSCGGMTYKHYENIGFFYDEWGKRTEALKAFKAAFSANPNSVGTLENLSNYTPDELGINLLHAIDQALDTLSPNDAGSRAILKFARARAMDKAGKYCEAWEQAIQANAEYAALHDLKPRPMPHLDSSRRFDSPYFEGSSPRKYATWDDGPKVLFVAGMPRSGKSTVENLIGEIPGVKLGYESNILPKTIDELNARIGLNFVKSLDDLPDSYVSLFQEILKEKLSARAQSHIAITNTMSSTYVLNCIPKILRTVPNSYFIFTDRDIWDNAWKIFLFHYRLDAPSYPYDFSCIVKQIEFWRNAVEQASKGASERVIILQYQTFVTDPRTSLEAISDLCGLPSVNLDFNLLPNDIGCAGPYIDLMKTYLAGD
ncbi:MAG: tetratricopeptide repeat protein [Gammaproteobacteria bacterium]|nr:tetratricopeptide repeat protein [Gammaproteobacteria bacterium]